METRNITEYKIYVLSLADLRGPVDQLYPVAVFDDLDNLKSFYNSCLAGEQWEDTVTDFNGDERIVTKSFANGSHLENFYPAESLDTYSHLGGVEEKWVRGNPSAEMFPATQFNPSNFGV